jgi:hypothetical protein
VELSRTEPVVAGSFIDFKITYTAGYFGEDGHQAWSSPIYIFH